MGDNTIWAGDIGCYVLGIFEPYKMQDFIISMGASLGITHGIKKVSDQKAVVFIGDSTFFHAGMAGLVNMKTHGTNPIVVILDNGVTAMTGHQPHPGSSFSATGEERIPMKIEDIVRSFGIKDVRIVNAFNQRELQTAIRELSRKDELGVIISRGLCMLVRKRVIRRKGGQFVTFEVTAGKSKRVSKLVEEFACPAIIKRGDEVYIKEDMCWGCGVCSQLVDPCKIVARKRRKK
jgi:indolepyruvate ferredoxin oxidoreductase alpha subunit